MFPSDWCNLLWWYVLVWLVAQKHVHFVSRTKNTLHLLQLCVSFGLSLYCYIFVILGLPHTMSDSDEEVDQKLCLDSQNQQIWMYDLYQK